MESVYNKIKLLIIMDLSYSETNKSCLNNSLSKQQYSFNKSIRFKYKKQVLNGKFYTLPSTISFRKDKSPSFPKDKKQLIFPGQKYKRILPSPSSYSIKSDIEISCKNKNGISFTKDNKKYRKIIPTPGPLDYENKKNFSTAKYSIGRSKKQLQYPQKMRKGKQSPGPAYLVDVNKLQKIVDKYVSNKCTKVYSQRTLPRSINKSSVQLKKYVSTNNIKKLSSLNKSVQIKNDNNNMSLSTQQQKFINPQSLTERKHTYNKNSLLLNSIKKNRIIKQPLKNHLESSFGKFDKAQKKTIFCVKSQIPGPKYNNFSQFSKLEKRVYNQRLNNLNKSKIMKNSLLLQTKKEK